EPELIDEYGRVCGAGPRLAGAHVPERHGAAVTAGGQCAAVGRKRRGDAAEKAAEAANLTAGVGVPDDARAAGTAGDGQPVVGGEGDDGRIAGDRPAD